MSDFKTAEECDYDIDGHDWDREYREGTRVQRCQDCRIWRPDWLLMMSRRSGQSEDYLVRVVQALGEEVWG